MFSRIRIFAFFFLLSSGASFAQDSNTLQNWFDYFQNNKINGNWSYIGDYSFRFQIGNPDTKWFQFHARPSVLFKHKAVYDLRGGIMLRYTDNSVGNSFEIRPWQGVKLYWPNFGRYRFSNFLRTEQRFSFDSDSDEQNFVFKIRYKLATNIPVNNSIITSKTYYLILGYEFFLNLDKGDANKEFIDDKTRIEVGAGYRINTKTDLKLRYIFQKSKVNLEKSNNSNDHIIRISVIQRFGFE